MQNKNQQDTQESVIELRDCTAGEQIRLTYAQPAFGMLFTSAKYKSHVEDENPIDMFRCGEAIDSQHEEFLIPAGGDWYIVVKGKDENQLLSPPTVERQQCNPVLWNNSHTDVKIVRKLPTPHNAPMASTLGYWERNTGFDFGQAGFCPLCNTFMRRDKVRCALVTIPGELPRVDYVIPICQHCYDTTNGKTFVAQKEALSKAPKA